MSHALRLTHASGDDGAGALDAAATALATTLERAARGDGEAWRALVELYTRRVFGLLYRQCGDRELAEEITQATFVKLVEKLEDFAGYEERGRFEPWLFRVAMNGLRDEMRRRKRQAVAVGGEGEPHREGGDAGPGFAEQPAWEGADPSEAASTAEQVEMLRQAVAKLGDADREILHLRHTAGLSFAQIAETLGEPLGTVLARGHRALGKLRKAMEAMEARTQRTNV